MAADQLARSSAEELRCRSACSDAVAQLFHLPSRRLFAKCRFIEVRPSIDVAVPLRSHLLRRDFRIHHLKGCGYLALEVNVGAICCGAERNAQPLVLRSVDARVSDHDDARETVRSVAAGVDPVITDSRSTHIRRDSFARSFCFAHGPPITRLYVASHARSNLHALRRDLPCVDARPPRGVTVSAERWDESDAARPQKRRRHFPPSHRPWVRFFAAARSTHPRAVTSLAAGLPIVHACLSRASAAPAPRLIATKRLCH